MLGFYVAPNVLALSCIGLTGMAVLASLMLQLQWGQIKAACGSGALYLGIGGIVFIFLLFEFIYVPRYVAYADFNQHKYYVLRTLVGVDPPEQMNHIYGLYECDNFGVFCHAVCEYESSTTQYDDPNQIVIVGEAETVLLKYGEETLCTDRDDR
jgi:hypothetical protein